MRTQAKPSSEPHPGFEAFGLELELRLSELGASGLSVGPSERISAWTLARELYYAGAVSTIRDMEPYLSAIIAKAPQQTDVFLSQAAPSPRQEGSSATKPLALSEKSPREERRQFLRRALLAVALVIGFVFLFDWVRVDPLVVEPEPPSPFTEPEEPSAISLSRPVTAGNDPPKDALKARIEPILGAVWSTGGNASVLDLARLIDLDGSDETVIHRARTLAALLNLTPHQPVRLCGEDDAPVQRLAAIVHAVLLIEGTETVPGLPAIRDAIRDVGVPVCAPDTALHAQARPLFSAWQLLLPVPLFLVGIWIYLRFRRERAHLRRTRPQSTPIRTDYVSNVLRGRNFWADDDRRLTRLLLAREPRESPAIDINRTINGTIAAGGRFLRIARQRLKPTPEYLVLIERNRMGDLTAARLRDLLRPLEKGGQLHFDVYYYKDSPAYVIAETDGRPVPLEAVRARFPDHRLVVLGTGRGLVEPITGYERPAAATLREWPRRTLLTPAPLREWSSTEFAIARVIDAPIARATRSGLHALPELLALEGMALPADPHGMGDGAQVALPDNLRLRPLRLMMDDEPADYPAERIIAELRRLLDRDGFRWLAALAVYPALQWDLTLFLGLELRAYRDDRRGDLRLATLTRLPWLQYGYMPIWLRLALIEELPERDGSRIYVRIVEALREAESKSPEDENRLVLSIGQERIRDPLVGPGDKPIEDQVLVKFLARGDAGDLPLPRNWRSPAREHRRAFWRRWSTWRPIVLATILSGVLAWFAPSPVEDPLTGAWLATMVLAFGTIGMLLAEALVLRRDGEDHAFARSPASESSATSNPRPSRSRRDDDDAIEPVTTRTPNIPVPKMTRIDAGSFQMGSAHDDSDAFDEERPRRAVRVAAFELGTYPVTFEEYDAFCAATNRAKPSDEDWGRGQMPVINVSWEDAQAYCAWLSDETGQTWRLPTEAEWEFACRAGTRTAYSWGDKWNNRRANGNRKVRRTTPVGKYPANAWGLHDMHGNVLEWVQDCWHGNYEGAPTDGRAWMDENGGDCFRAVLRGGSWSYGPRWLRSALRLRNLRDIRSGNVGFRVARTLTP